MPTRTVPWGTGCFGTTEAKLAIADNSFERYLAIGPLEVDRPDDVARQVRQTGELGQITSRLGRLPSV